MNDLIGRTIAEVRPMTDAEMADLGWDLDYHGRPAAIVLDDGVVLFPSRDAEGNGGGALFGTDAEGPFVVRAEVVR